MTLDLREIATLVGATGEFPSLPVTGIAVDSRSVRPGDIFCAIVGARVDGHDYLDDAANRGAMAALVTREVPSPLPVLRVPSVPDALASIAHHIRDDFAGTVVAVTGSVGKTTVKELIAAALAPEGPVLKSLGNQNTEYGLPMTWMRLEPEHAFAILEMAMRGFGQVDALCKFSRPRIGVITSIGSAHAGEVGGSQGIAKAKGELIANLPPEGRGIVPSGPHEDYFRSIAKCPVITFGSSAESHVRVIASDTAFDENCVRFRIELDGQSVEGKCPGLGTHQALNAAAAIAAAGAVGVDPQKAADSLENAVLPTDRLRFEPMGRGGVLVDVYNSSPESCAAALRVLAEAPSGHRVAILADMLELGEESERLHREVGALPEFDLIDSLFVLGEDTAWLAEEAARRNPHLAVERLESLDSAASILSGLREGDVALIKGSRKFELERAVTQARSRAVKTNA